KKLRVTQKRRASNDRNFGAARESQTAQRNRTHAHQTPRWTSNPDSLRNRQTALDRIASSRFLRHAPNTAHRKRQSPRRPASAGAQPAASRNNHRLIGILAKTLSASPKRAKPKISET